MKDVTVEVVVLGMNAKVFDSFRTLSREQFQHDVTQCRVQHGRLEVARPGLVLLGDGDTVFVRRFFEVLDNKKLENEKSRKTIKRLIWSETKKIVIVRVSFTFPSVLEKDQTLNNKNVVLGLNYFTHSSCYSILNQKKSKSKILEPRIARTARSSI